MTADDAKLTVPDLIQRTFQELLDAKNELAQGIREVTWAYQDAMAQAQLPVTESGLAQDREAQCSEFAVRAVMPRFLSTTKTKVENVLDLLDQLQSLVPPLVGRPNPEVNPEATQEIA